MFGFKRRNKELTINVTVPEVREILKDYIPQHCFMVTGEDDDGVNYTVYYKGVKQNNIYAVIIDSRIKDNKKIINWKEEMSK